jgi:hypothetical protein
MARAHSIEQNRSMKRIAKLTSAALAATVLLATAGCDSIRDYSVNSYQGVIPMNDFRGSGSVATSLPPETPNPSIPQPAPTAAPAAAASGGDFSKPATSPLK